MTELKFLKEISTKLHSRQEHPFLFSTRSFARSIAKIVIKGAIKKLFNKN